MIKIKYKAGYKYQLVEDYVTYVKVRPEYFDVNTEYISLSTAGLLKLRKGYAWDGPSGPTIDTNTFMRGSLIHDALYQLMRDGYLMRGKTRKQADEELRLACRQDGMNWFRAWYVYYACRIFGRYTSRPQDARPVITAP